MGALKRWKALWVMRRSMILAVIGGTVAGSLGYLHLHMFEKACKDSSSAVAVWVAARYVPQGIPARAAFFRTVTAPKAYVQPGAVSAYDVLESSPGHPQFRTAVALPEGTQLTRSVLVPLAAGVGLSQRIPQGQVAVSFGVDAVRGVGGFLRPGDWVDILHTVGGSDLQGDGRTTVTLLQAVPVLAVGKKWFSPFQEEQRPENGPPLEMGEPEPDRDVVVTVSLNPLSAARLAQARENGSLSLILRAEGDGRVWEGLP